MKLPYDDDFITGILLAAKAMDDAPIPANCHRKLFIPRTGDWLCECGTMNCDAEVD